MGAGRTIIKGFRLSEIMETKTYMELIELIEGQRSIINQQAEAIKDLLNQNAEQENMINVMMKSNYF